MNIHFVLIVMPKVIMYVFFFVFMCSINRSFCKKQNLTDIIKKQNNFVDYEYLSMLLNYLLIYTALYEPTVSTTVAEPTGFPVRLKKITKKNTFFRFRELSKPLHSLIVSKT